MATILAKTAGLVALARTVDAGSFANAARLIGARAKLNVHGGKHSNLL